MNGEFAGSISYFTSFSNVRHGFDDKINRLEREQLIDHIRNLTPTKTTQTDTCSTILNTVGTVNSGVSVALANKNQKIQLFRGADGRFYGNPYVANKVLNTVSKGSFVVGTVVSGAQLVNGM